ncbi:protein-(glutamine-N5) methyltransferase, release factor-specific [Treponema primitia ZAS-2]|uniref:Release factor glutamine methyltransferase n=1 Tax=Treponema primitia (strain ATCC BAA-887 / DSM 12427 / ZAS-2) TaxID=545694 RepID=F5YPJ2_TREPZ|nr:peptide chain release factor N(5)-glutamine methyltransferase [Treponema primitia]AEF83736.1 protein-(glutamine-N5) methyltransferase, release factor-specific [Treponema primitia ZAS-2]
MTIREALIQGTARLKKAGIESPGLDAALLLAFTLTTVKEQLLLRDREPLNASAAENFTALLDRRIAGECTAWLLGRKEFYGLEFMVTPDVLVPRPDTETLVEAALTVLGKSPSPSGAACNADFSRRVPRATCNADFSRRVPRAILDLCTGSGAVAISLKYQCPELRVYASDISPQALAIARENAGRLLADQPANPGVGTSRPEAGKLVHFLEGDLFTPLTPDIPPFTLITANPPYVPSADIAGLSPEVRLEPLLALNGGRDGLDLIRRIIDEAPAYLLPGATLLMEADPRQMAAIALILEKRGYRNIRTFQDLSGRDRVIGALSPG